MSAYDVGNCHRVVAEGVVELGLGEGEVLGAFGGRGREDGRGVTGEEHCGVKSWVEGGVVGVTVVIQQSAWSRGIVRNSQMYQNRIYAYLLSGFLFRFR